MKTAILTFIFIVFSTDVSHCQTVSSTEGAKLVSDAIYANSSLSGEQIVELLSSGTAELLQATIYDQENQICHLIARRGHCLALFQLMNRLDDNERKQLIVRLNKSYNELGNLVQHHIILGSCTPYWIEQFQELGLDFSIQPMTIRAQESLRQSVIIRWGELTDAYRAYGRIKDKGMVDETTADLNSITQEKIDRITFINTRNSKPILKAQEDGLETDIPPRILKIK